MRRRPMRCRPRTSRERERVSANYANFPKGLNHETHGPGIIVRSSMMGGRHNQVVARVFLPGVSPPWAHEYGATPALEWGRPPVCRFRETLSPGILQLACRASQNRQTGALPHIPGRARHSGRAAPATGANKCSPPPIHFPSGDEPILQSECGFCQLHNSDRFGPC